jgi:mono/diheme cytochrome c family protein
VIQDRWRPGLTPILLIGLAATSAVVTGCSGEEAASTTIPPGITDGEELFELRAVGPEPGCVTCHAREPDQVVVGPSLSGLAGRAGDRVAGLDAETYVRRSILDPSAHTVDGFEAGRMPVTFGELLSDEQIDALVRYLLELP